MITALISRKGGVGKTTTAVNLAAALAARRERVLLIDLDSQCSASLSLGVERRYLAPSIADVLGRGVPAGQTIRASDIDGLDLMTASTDLTSLERDLNLLPDHELCLRRALEPIAGRYGIILLDCPPTMNLLARAALMACDHYLIPAIPHFLALEGVKNLLSAAERLGFRFGLRPRPIGVLLTLVDNRSRLIRDTIQTLRETLGELVFDAEVHVNIQLAEAPAFGKSIFDHAPRSTGAQAYRQLADEFLSRARGNLSLPLRPPHSESGR